MAVEPGCQIRQIPVTEAEHQLVFVHLDRRQEELARGKPDGLAWLGESAAAYYKITYYREGGAL